MVSRWQKIWHLRYTLTYLTLLLLELLIGIDENIFYKGKLLLLLLGKLLWAPPCVMISTFSIFNLVHLMTRENKNNSLRVSSLSSISSLSEMWQSKRCTSKTECQNDLFMKYSWLCQCEKSSWIKSQTFFCIVMMWRCFQKNRIIQTIWTNNPNDSNK